MIAERELTPGTLPRSAEDDGSVVTLGQSPQTKPHVLLAGPQASSEWLTEWRREEQENNRKIQDLTAEIEALHADARPILGRLDDAWNRDTRLNRARFIQMLMLHFPLLAPVAEILEDHIDEQTGSEEDCLEDCLAGAISRALTSRPDAVPTVFNDPYCGGRPSFVNLPPCRESFSVMVAADCRTPVGLEVDGAYYRVKPSPRYQIHEGERTVHVLGRGYTAPLEAAWREIRDEARGLGVPLPSNGGRLLGFQGWADEIASLIGPISEARYAQRRRRAAP